MAPPEKSLPPVFAHYIVGGIGPEQAKTDVTQAKAMGIDAFALNVLNVTMDWSTNAIKYLFDAAKAEGFQLFFSFDMNNINSPGDAVPLMKNWCFNETYKKVYYYFDNRAFVSTYLSGIIEPGNPVNANDLWQKKFISELGRGNIYFVPYFKELSTGPDAMFNTFPIADGLFAWENSWPWSSDVKTTVSSTADVKYSEAAKKAKKTFMMGISTVQFKHMDPGNNYYRAGGLNLILRMSQVMSVKPDFVEIQTWNDAGESHYIASFCKDTIGDNVKAYTNDYDHSGWQILLKSFIDAYKHDKDFSAMTPAEGYSVQGVFWHTTLLSKAVVKDRILNIAPSGIGKVQDVIDVAVIVGPKAAGVRVNVSIGNSQGVFSPVDSFSTVQGLNKWEVQGLRVGKVKVEVLSSTGTILLTGTGPKEVLDKADLYNFNPQVVALAPLKK